MSRSLFVTKLYEAQIADDLLDELAHSIRSLADGDEAGQRWCQEHRYAGYTSYASMNEVKSIIPGIDQIIIYLTAVVILLVRPRGLLGRAGMMES